MASQALRGGSALLNISQSVANGNYVGAGISTALYTVGLTHANPNTIEGLSIVGGILAGGVAAGAAGAATAAGLIIGMGLIASEIEGLVGGVALLDSYASGITAISGDIKNVISQSDTDDTAFQNYITQTNESGPLIAQAAILAAFPNPVSLATGYQYAVGALGLIGAALLLF